MTADRLTLCWCALLQIGLALMAPSSGFSQSTPTLEASSDARQVVIDGFFEVVFTIKNADGDNFQPPSFKDFTVLSGPNAMTSTTILNGKVMRQKAYSYTLKPRRPGKFSIGSASMSAGGRTIRSQSLSIDVVESKKGKGSENEQLFLRAEPASTSAYPGQQILLDYKLYFRQNIEAYDIVKESDYQGFYAKDIRRYDSRRTQEVVNGVQYTALIIKRVALFPQRAGQLSVGALDMQLGILDEASSSDFPSLFFNQRLNRVPVSSQPLTITVNPLPAGAPNDFSGAVGQFEMTTSVNRNTLSTDDALSVRLQVRGNGDSKRIQPPGNIFPDAFEVYEPKVVEESNYDLDGQLMSEKTFEYLLLPKSAGKYRIAPMLGVFDPSTQKYTAVQGGSFEVEVTQGKGNRPPDELNADGFEEENLPAESPSISAKQLLSALLWAALAAMLIVAIVLGRKYFRKLSARRTQVEMQHEQAEKIAKSHLATAQLHLQSAQSGAFYEEVSKALLGYASRKLNIPLAILNRENVQQKLKENQLPETLIEQFSQIIRTCDMALYAGMDNAAKMQETYQAAQSVMVDMERSLK